MINFDFLDGKLIFYIGGDIDHHSAKHIREECDRLMVDLAPREVVLNLDGVSFMDSSGLGLVLGRYTKASSFGMDFSVMGADRRVMQIFEMAGLERIIKIYN